MMAVVLGVWFKQCRLACQNSETKGNKFVKIKPCAPCEAQDLQNERVFERR